MTPAHGTAATPAAERPETHGLHRELGLKDLVSLQILLVLGSTWVGNAAKEGASHLSLWLIAIVIFFVPLVLVVDFCAGIWPTEGGVYQWAKSAIGPFAGFLAAWNFGAYGVLLLASTGVLVTAAVAYALGPDFAWIANSTPLIIGVNFALIALMLGINILGLGAGKWMGHVGTAAIIASVGLCASVLVWHPDATALHPHVAPQPRIALTLPALSLITVNLFTKLAFNALTGLEQVAVFAGETRHAGRSIRRSAWIAAPILALLYISLTCAVLDYTPLDKIDLTAPLPQLLATAFGSASGGARTGAWLASGINLAIVVYIFGQYGVTMAEASRLPMVAAWDHLLPAGFTRLHPRYGTPVLSLCVVAGVGFLLSLVASGGAGAAEAWQVVATSSFICSGIYYLLIFAIPLVCGTRFGLRPDLRPGLLLRLGCVSALLLTVLSIVFNLVPIVDVASTWVYTAKVAGAALVINVVGAGIYWRAARKGKAVLF